jgi:hypothetical protein
MGANSEKIATALKQPEAIRRMSVPAKRKETVMEGNGRSEIENM